MQRNQVLKRLRKAGINDPDKVLDTAIDFIRSGSDDIDSATKLDLTHEEMEFLRRSGAELPGQSKSSVIEDNLIEIAGEFALMVETAYSLEEVAKILQISSDCVRDMDNRGSLYAVSSYSGRVYPAWQFYNEDTLPGLESVLARISSDAHPVTIQRFFLSSSPDLIGTAGDRQPLSPRDWLIAGNRPEAVVLLAKEI